MNVSPEGAGTARTPESTPGTSPSRPRLPLDAVVGPALLLLIARDLLVHDPPRVLAWRVLHDERLSAVPAWLGVLMPRPPAGLDQDPIALLLGAVASGLAAAWLLLGLAGARAVWRWRVLVAAALALVVLPTLAIVAMGSVTDRPYGQDGGVVQLPLALEKILAGETPYGADYSDSILGKQARVSSFWKAYGGNPILHHHAYLPGTHLLTMPFYLVFRGLGVVFDTRFVTLLAWAAAAFLAVRLVPGQALTAAAVVAVNPLVYWQQIFGANDMMAAALLLLAVLLAERGRTGAAAAVLGLACATKQLAWPFAPFLLVHLAGLASLGELATVAGQRRLARPVLVVAAVFAAVVAPLALLDPAAFWGDVVAYNAGLRAGDSYPLGGTPGLGFANLLIYVGAVTSLRDHVPFGIFYVLLIPVGLLLLRRQIAWGSASAALATGSAALLASLYFSRVAHPNYVILAAVLLPLALLATRALAVDVVVVPLLLLALAVQVAEGEVFRTTWEAAVSSRLVLAPVIVSLLPRAGPDLTLDPLGLLFSAIATGLAAAYLVAGIAGWDVRRRQAVVLAAVVILVLVPTSLVVAAGEPSPRNWVRAQDDWTAGVADVASRASGLPPPSVREAWSTSFRQDPPAPMPRCSPPGPAVSLLGAMLALVRLRDPRLLVLAAGVLVAWLLARLVPRDQRPLAWAVALLSPPAAIGTVFGSPELLVLAAGLGAWVLARRRLALRAGLVLGAVSSLVPRTMFLASLALAGNDVRPRRPTRVILGAAAGFAAITVPALLVGTSAAAQGGDSLWAAVGLPNVLFYWGGGRSAAARALMTVLPVLVALAGAWWALRRQEGLIAVAAAVSVAGSWVWSGASPHDLSVPATLAALSLIVRDDDPALES